MGYEYRLAYRGPLIFLPNVINVVCPSQSIYIYRMSAMRLLSSCSSWTSAGDRRQPLGYMPMSGGFGC